MGGDLKFLATIYGINAANSLFPCIWCEEFNSKNDVDLNQKFSITRSINLASEKIKTCFEEEKNLLRLKLEDMSWKK